MVKLYPKGFLSTLEEMYGDVYTYDEIYKKIRAGGQAFVGSSYHSVSLFYALGIGEGGNATAEIIVKHRQFLDSLKKEELEEFQAAISSVQADLARLKREIETFFIENQLEPVKETTSVQPSGPFSMF